MRDAAMRAVIERRALPLLLPAGSPTIYCGNAPSIDVARIINAGNLRAKHRAIMSSRSTATHDGPSSGCVCVAVCQLGCNEMAIALTNAAREEAMCAYLAASAEVASSAVASKKEEKYVVRGDSNASAKARGQKVAAGRARRLFISPEPRLRAPVRREMAACVGVCRAR